MRKGRKGPAQGRIKCAQLADVAPKVNQCVQRATHVRARLPMRNQRVNSTHIDTNIIIRIITIVSRLYDATWGSMRVEQQPLAVSTNEGIFHI